MKNRCVPTILHGRFLTGIALEGIFIEKDLITFSSWVQMDLRKPTIRKILNSSNSTKTTDLT